MNFDKTKVLLKKINAIHDGVADGGGSFSALEKDLLLEYVKELYECIQLDVKEEAAPQVAQEIVTPPPAPAPPEEIKEAQVATPVTPVAASSNGHHSPSSNGHAPKPVEPSASTIMMEMDPDMEELFAESAQSDLSQRFANMPVQDIGKAMGINERILTINELFKGDQQQFKLTADTLNEFTSFAEAKAYLSKGPASKYDWTHSKRKKKAAVFIKLVRRRYL